MKTPADFEYTTVQATGTSYLEGRLHLPIANLDGVLSPQPVHMKCFTC